MNNCWVNVKVNDIAELIRGITYKKDQASKEYQKFYKPILRANNINGVLNFDDLIYVPAELIKEEQFIKKEDIIFAMSSGSMHLVGKSAQAKSDFDGSYGAFCSLLRLTSNIQKKYISYFFKSNNFRQLVNKIAKGTNINNLKREHILNSAIPLAPLPEQRAIVAKIEQLFSELDNGIANLKTAQDKLEIYRQAVLKKAFEGELTKTWREQQTDLSSADELLEQIKLERQRHYEQQIADWEKAVVAWEEGGKEGKKPAKSRKAKEMPLITAEFTDELSVLPKNWFYDYLAYAGDLGRGKSKHRPRNDASLFGGDYPFIQTAEVKAQETVVSYTQTYNDFGLKQSKLWPKGTLCITIAANIAETSFLGIDACFPDSIVGFTPFDKVINSKYVEYFFRSAKAKISAWAPATAQKNINLTTLENLILPFCSLKEQTQIVQEIESRLSVCDKLSDTIKEQLEKAEALRQSILKKAFEGRLLSDVEIEACKQEADWEPAEQLLARIKAESGN